MKTNDESTLANVIKHFFAYKLDRETLVHNVTKIRNDLFLVRMAKPVDAAWIMRHKHIFAQEWPEVGVFAE